MQIKYIKLYTHLFPEVFLGAPKKNNALFIYYEFDSLCALTIGFREDGFIIDFSLYRSESDKKYCYRPLVTHTNEFVYQNNMLLTEVTLLLIQEGLQFKTKINALVDKLNSHKDNFQKLDLYKALL